MKVKTTFIHPIKGVKNLTVENAPSVEDTITKLEEFGCIVLSAEEENVAETLTEEIINDLKEIKDKLLQGNIN